MGGTATAVAGRPLALTGTHLARVRLLLEHDLALYALHLPLDCHPTLGNNAGLADALDLRERAPFGDYRGVLIGIQGRLPAPLSLEKTRRTPVRHAWHGLHIIIACP